MNSKRAVCGAARCILPHHWEYSKNKKRGVTLARFPKENKPTNAREMYDKGRARSQIWTKMEKRL